MAEEDDLFELAVSEKQRKVMAEEEEKKAIVERLNQKV